MKTILEVKFSGECKAPVFTTRRGKHLFCGEPAPEGKSYCASCGQRMVLPTRHYADSASQADMFGGGKARSVSREGSGAQNHIVPVDSYFVNVARGLGSNRNETTKAVYATKIRVVA